jgi:hypothetical protein
MAALPATSAIAGKARMLEIGSGNRAAAVVANHNPLETARNSGPGIVRSHDSFQDGWDGDPLPDLVNRL